MPASLSLSVGGAASFGAFTPGLADDYDTTLAATVVSTAGDAALSVTDPAPAFPGRLVNGAFALAHPVQARTGATAFGPVGATPLVLRSWSGPTSNEQVTIDLRQSIGAGEGLRTGTYAKTFTFTLSTTTP